ncbi:MULTISPECIES: DUF3389 family protein [Shewanella]|uniref:DUF3389 family protein n=1 Tax=Shewanella TaxID=22 RepID=UPI00048BE378|nr:MULTISPECIES: DUF3389 family protein [Shewanella]QLE85328.1 DUF3389 family protein [Shewanella sp. Scap07]
MIVEFSQGKIITSAFEIQIRLTAANTTLFAMAEDVKAIDDARLLLADAGAVRWSIALDNLEQLNQVKQALAID